MHLDSVANLLSKLNVTVLGLLDSPLIMETEPRFPENTTSYSTMLREAYDFFKPEDEEIPGVSLDCGLENLLSEWRCLLGE